MRNDIQKVVYERQRRGSREGSLRTSKKLDPHVDYDEFDWGPSRASSSRRRQEGQGRFNKHTNENTRPLYRFFQKNVGRPWDDVYSEVCEHLDARKEPDRFLRSSIKWMVNTHITMIGDVPHNPTLDWRWDYHGLYVDPETGILCERKKQPWVRPAPPVTKIQWYNNVWFEQHKFDGAAKCGCVHFKVPKVESTSRWSYRDPGPAVCIHGNESIPYYVWYVVEYGYHAPDEVYEVRHYSWYYYGGKFNPSEESKKYQIEKPGDRYITYYRDVPHLMAIPFVVKQKVVNKKELRKLHQLMEESGATYRS